MKQFIHLAVYSLCICALAVFTIVHTSPVTLITDVLAVVVLVASVWFAQRSETKLPAVLALCAASTLGHLPVGLWITGILFDFNTFSPFMLIAYYMLNTALVAVIYGYGIAMYRNVKFFNISIGSAHLAPKTRAAILVLISITVLLAIVISFGWLRISPVF